MPSKGELKRNLKLLKERLESRPMDLDARMRIARTYRLLNDASEAVAHYGAVARYLSLAGHPLQAVAVLKELLQVDARHEESLLFLAKLYARTRAADISNRGRVAVPIATDDGDDTVMPLEDGLPHTTTGIWRAIRPSTTDDLSIIRDAEDIGAVVDDNDDDSDDDNDDDVSDVIDRGDHVSVDGDMVVEDSPIDPPAEDTEGVEEVDDADVDPIDNSIESSVLARVPLFASLDAASFQQLSASMVLLTAEPGEILFSEGEPGDSCLVIARGEAVVTRTLEDGVVVERSRLRPGDVAGVFALVAAEVRQATLTAVGNVEYFEVDRDVVTALLKDNPATRAALLPFIRERVVDMLFLEVPLLMTLPAPARQELRERLSDKRYDDDDEVFSAWADTDGLWVVVAGEVIVGEELDDAPFRIDARLQVGDWLVCAAASVDDIAGVTAQAVGETVLLALPHVAVAPLLALRADALDELGPAQVLTDAVRVGTLRR